VPLDSKVRREESDPVDETAFSKFLIDRSVMVVHFSHFGVMGHAVEFPVDLKHAIDNHQTETRSCCALWPGHKMNLPGAVGVIFKPTFAQVISVLPDDSGSSDFSGSENSGGYTPSEETVIESLDVPVGCYNEWRVRGAEPIGIFVANPNDIYVKTRMKIPMCGDLIDPIGSAKVPLSVVFDAFPLLPIYTMGTDGLITLRGSGV